MYFEGSRVDHPGKTPPPEKGTRGLRRPLNYSPETTETEKLQSRDQRNRELRICRLQKPRTDDLRTSRPQKPRTEDLKTSDKRSVRPVGTVERRMVFCTWWP